jgi:5'-nucleotidase/UDP-sugar diphosphatase
MSTSTARRTVLASGALGGLVLTGLTLTTALEGCLVQGVAVDLTEQDVQLTVFHTSDWHSRLLPYTYDPPAPIENLGLELVNAPFGGVARFATLIEQERARSDRHVWLDTGDCFQGAPIFNIFEGEPEIRLQSQLGLDAAVAGNHEFDLGVVNYVNQFQKWGSYVPLAANYDPEDPTVPGNSPMAEVIRPYTIINKNGLKVLVIGHGNFSSLNSIGEGGNSLGVTPMEHNEITQMYIDQLAPSVDVVTVITHLGLEFDIGLVEGYKSYYPKSANLPDHMDCTLLAGGETWECSVPGVRGIDLILGGHLHIVLNPPREAIDVEGRRVPIVHSGAFMQFLGRLDTVFRHASRLDRDDWYGFELVDYRHKVLPIDSRLDDDLMAYRTMEPYLLDLAINYDLQRPIAFSPTGITRTASNGGDSAMGNLVANAIRTRNLVETDFALTNSPGIRDNIPPGPVTAEMLFNVFPFENTIATLYMSGREVQELFDVVSSRSTGRGCRSQVQVSGVSYTVRCDCKQNRDGCCAQAKGFGEFPAACADNIRVAGQELNPNGTYEVGANDYMARGGSGFDMLRRNTTQRITGISLRTAVEEYMQKFPACSEAEVASMGPCKRESDAGSLACKYADLVGKYGSVACVSETGLVDGRISRKVPQ